MSIRPNQESWKTFGLPVSSRRGRAWAALALGLLCAGLPGCETDDPCARREAACLDVVLIGKKDDGAGNPVVYRGLQVSVFAPNVSNQTGNPPADKCEITATGGKMVRRVFGSELGPVGMTLATTQVPELTRKESYSPTIQGKLTFQLPAEFNALADRDLDDVLLQYSSDDERVAGLKELRDRDPRAIRILITQAGQTKTAWDSRCEEGVFSSGEWLIKRYYRVGQNQHVAAFAVLDGATTASP